MSSIVMKFGVGDEEYAYEVPDKGEIEIYDKVRRYHAFERILDEVEYRWSCEELKEPPSMAKMLEMADELKAYEDCNWCIDELCSKSVEIVGRLL